jgi:hypothetical protein
MTDRPLRDGCAKTKWRGLFRYLSVSAPWFFGRSDPGFEVSAAYVGPTLTELEEAHLETWLSHGELR